MVSPLAVVGITVENGRVVAAAVRRGRTIWAADASYADANDLAHVLASLAAERPKGARQARVALGAGVARLKTVHGLPRLTRSDLAAHVRLHSRSYFLQNGVPLITDARPVADGAQLVAAPVPLVEAVAAGLAAAGLECTAIVPAELLPAGTALEAAAAVAAGRTFPLLLLPDAQRRRLRETDARALRRWAMAALASLLLALASYAFGLVLQERAAARELETLGPALDAAITVRRDLEATTAALGLLGVAETTGGGRARLLARITTALPDSAFLAAVRIERTGAGRLIGYAPSAARVLARLERIAAFSDAALEGPVTREVVAGHEWERFTIRFRER